MHICYRSITRIALNVATNNDSVSSGMCICSVISDEVSQQGHTADKDRTIVNNELEEGGRKQSCLHLKYQPGIITE